VGVSEATRHLYAIAIGSNRAALGMRRAEDIVSAALTKMRSRGIAIIKHSATLASAPVGPARRRFGNAAAIIETRLDPDALLRELKSIERAFGRRPGRRWGDRPLDLDIILWSGGRLHLRQLVIPHREWRRRAFVAVPLCTIAPDWRDPVTGSRVRHITARLPKR
jgi:2-amino-4-hydroxy-6-hydroxymethyldihydropteridine diphosphokinase